MKIASSPSPYNVDFELRVIATNKSGMTVDDDLVRSDRTEPPPAPKRKRRRLGESVSKHFKAISEDITAMKRVDVRNGATEKADIKLSSKRRKSKRKRTRSRKSASNHLVTDAQVQTVNTIRSNTYPERFSELTLRDTSHSSHKRPRGRRRGRKVGIRGNVSNHFVEASQPHPPVATSPFTGKTTEDICPVLEDRPTSKDTLSGAPRQRRKARFRRSRLKSVPEAPQPPTRVITSPLTPPKPAPRIVAGLNIDDLSSDSTLTDVPSDFESNFTPSQPRPPTLPPTKVAVVKVRRPTKSPFFPHKLRPNFLSCLPFPPLSAPTFGLMQERLAHDPFRLLLATIFLNKTRGEQAMPVFYKLMGKYPTPAALATADIADVVSIIHALGFQNQRARKCVQMARMWVERSPVKGKRYRKLHYPRKGDGRDVGAQEVVPDDDTRVAWEIAHLPGLGPYSHDSWRMFCRDELRGLAEAWNGEGAPGGEEGPFEPEWKRVLPRDKELRAYMTWMWLKEGWAWNKETGERVKADEDLMEKARGGGVVKEEEGEAFLMLASGHGPVAKPAGECT